MISGVSVKSIRQVVRAHTKPWFWISSLPLALALASESTVAQEIAFKIIDGRPCAKCTLHGPQKSIPANVVIDLGMRVPVLMHSRTAKVLRIEQDTPLEIRFGDATLNGLRVRSAELKEVEELTTRHASELDEIPAVAILGMPAFNGFAVQLDVGDGSLKLLPAGETPAPTASRPTEGEPRSWSGTYEERGYGYWLSAKADDFAMRALFMTKFFDTMIDDNAADLAGSAAGAIDRLTIGELNIARYVALRPEDLSTTPEPHPDLIIGTNLLAHFRVTIDSSNRTIRFEQTREPRFPTEEREYYKARLANDADGIESFLKANASSRLAGEAGMKLLELRLDAFPPNREAICRAIRMQTEAAPKERQSETTLALADELLDGKREDRLDLAAEAVKVGLEHVTTALNGRTAFDLRARMGVIALRRGDAKEARRQLLSAAFGLPKDPLVNLWLGELYEKTGKLTRAWSRFVQSAISQGAPPDALRGLDRLNRNPEFRATFSMNDAAELLEGRITEFHAVGRFAATQPAGMRPAHLVELFTCLDEASTLGPQLAFDGLREFHETTDTVFVQYHLPAPANDPLANTAAGGRSAMYAIQAAPAVVFDGANPVTTGGSDKDTDKLFAAYRKASLVPATQPASWQLDGAVTADGTQVRGEITLVGPEIKPELRLHLLLCEKIVLVPGANGIILHHDVVRAMLSPAEGLAVPPGTGRRAFKVSADLATVSADLEQAIKAQEKAKEIRFIMRPTFVDPASATIVAVLQDQKTNQAMAARRIDVRKRGETPK